MVNAIDIIYSIVREIRKVVPGAKHYIGKLPENYNAPCFLHTMVFSGDKRQTKYIKDASIDLQIIYFDSKGSYSGTSYENNLKMMATLRQFLDTFLLSVGTRRLKFDYSFGDADDQLAINMEFRFKDDVINIEEVYELMQEIYVERKEV